MFRPLTPGESVQALRRFFGFTRIRGKSLDDNRRKSHPLSEYMTSPHEEDLSEESVMAKRREGLKRFNAFWLGDE